MNWKLGLILSSTLLLTGGCSKSSTNSPEGQKPTWTKSLLDREIANCTSSFSSTNPSLKQHALTYCNCMIPKLTARMLPSGTKEQANQISSELLSDGSADACLTTSIESANSAHTAPGSERPWLKFVEKCKIILKDANANPIDQDICTCASRKVGSPEQNPAEFENALGTCVASTFK
jgi:hypothetical protein